MKARIHVLALGGTIATRPDASGAMQMGPGARVLLETCLRAGLDRSAIVELFDGFG